MQTGRKGFSLKRYSLILMIVVLIVMIVATVISVTEGGGMVVSQIDSGMLGVSGNNDQRFIQLDTVSAADFVETETLGIGTQLSGESTKKIWSGSFQVQSLGECTVFAYKSISRSIVIHHADGILIYNLPSEQLTEKAWNDLQNALSL